MSVEAVKWALYDAPMLLTPAGKPDTTARFVLVVFAEHADKEGRNAYPGPARVKFVTGLDVRTVERVVRRLEDGKLLERDGFTAAGSVKWKLRTDLVRPASDWEEIEATQQAEREAVATRVKKHRAARTPVPLVTDAGSVTRGTAEESVTDSECVTDWLVTDPASVCNGRSAGGTTIRTTTGGHAAPQTPLRTDSPQAACRTDQPTAPDRSKTPRTQLDPESPVPSAAAFVRARERSRPLRTTWQQQREATAGLDPAVRQAVRDELDAQRRRATIRAVPDPIPDETAGAAS